uniref:Candidate secreted effector n=1 Tax=Meloidogyne incognita TaxID=6306 RepID=A0A914MI09_MELIC
MVPRPRHGTLMTPGPNMVLYCLHLFYKTLLYPSISESDPNCHSPIRPRQNTKCHSPIRPTLKIRHQK